jgi:hypothetical protein
VTVAGWMIMIGSVAIVLTVFQLVAGLHSLDTRDAVERALDEPVFDGVGMSVDRVLGIIRVLGMIAAACATATAVLGWQALQRAKSARVALSILAVPLFLAGLSTGGVFSTMVVVAVALLWAQPARDWFDGSWKPEPAEPRTPGRRSGSTTSRSTEQPWGQPRQPEQPPPYAGWPPPQQPGQPGQPGQPAQPPAQQPPARAADHDWAPPTAPMPFGPAAPIAATVEPRTAQRPPAVMSSAVITWVCSVLLGALFVTGATWLIASPDSLMDEMTKQDPDLMADGTITVGLLRGMLGVLIGVVVLWVAVACVAAFFVLRRRGWARLVLLVSSAVSGVALLVTTLVNVGMAIPLAGAVAVFALLLRRDVTAWFSRR